MTYREAFDSVGNAHYLPSKRKLGRSWLIRAAIVAGTLVMAAAMWLR